MLFFLSNRLQVYVGFPFVGTAHEFFIMVKSSVKEKERKNQMKTELYTIIQRKTNKLRCNLHT